MSKNIYGLTDPTNAAAVEEIRKKFLADVDTNPDLYHTKDVERCRSEDWQIERFLLEKGSPDNALKALTTAMRWKKSFGVHDRDHTYFPRELIEIFGYEKPGLDKEGRICIWSTQRHYRKINDFSELIKQFVVFYIERIDRMAGNRGIIAAADSKDISLSNMDMSMAKFSAEVISYYPSVVHLSISVDMAWYFVSTWKIARALLPKKMMEKAVLIKREQLTDYVNIDEIPVSFGGIREPIYELVDQMSPLKGLSHLGFNDKQIDNFYHVYKFMECNTFL